MHEKVIVEHIKLEAILEMILPDVLITADG
jgi:hypothetical protein